MSSSQVLIAVAALALYFARQSEACYGATLLRSGGLTCDEKRQIVDLHNRLRQAVAVGRVPGQSPASNMLEMAWDEELAAQAQRWANRCQFEHDSNAARRVSVPKYLQISRNSGNLLAVHNQLLPLDVPFGDTIHLVFAGFKVRPITRFAVGQNLAVTWTWPKPNDLGPFPDFKTQIELWFNEVYQYRGQFSHATGHYTQMIWGDTYLIGCGYSYYLEQNRYTKLYVCNYGPGGNIRGYKPYRRGSPSCTLYGTSPSPNYYGLCTVRGIFTDPCCNNCYLG